MSHPYEPQGYLPPADVYSPPIMSAADPYDPLVNPGSAGVNGWFTRVGWLFKRSWKSMVAIFAITHLLPLIGFAVVGVVAVLVLGTAFFASSQGAGAQGNADVMAIGLPVLIVVVLVLALLMLILQSAGYAAATYAVTKEAAGQQVKLGEALGYGFRRAMGLAGWQVVVGLLLLLGLIACLLPVFYVYAATALFGPVYLFERRSPIGRTFSIFNKNLGRVLGRLALLLVAMIGVNIVTGVFDRVATALAGASDSLGVTIGTAVISSSFSLLLELPLAMIIFAGILLTYAEQRGHEAPTSVQTLAAEL